MAALDDQATHLDALGFGTLLHTALQSVLSRPEWCDGDREAELADELCAAATAYARRQWGPLVPPMVALQVDVARQRLRAAARVQAEQARAGWVIQACEQKVDFTLDGVPIRGKIDRLDRHRDGRWRIVDYKTSDQGSKPDASHLARARTDTPPYAQVSIDGKSQRWTDLQLPLYLQALPPGERAAVELAYFNLPKAVEHTRIEVWAGFAAADLGTAAEACARGVLADIRAGRFWPPTDTSAADDFEPLFTAEPEECFDAELIRGKKATGELAR